MPFPRNPIHLTLTRCILHSKLHMSNKVYNITWRKWDHRSKDNQKVHLSFLRCILRGIGVGKWVKMLWCPSFRTHLRNYGNLKDIVTSKNSKENFTYWYEIHSKVGASEHTIFVIPPPQSNSQLLSETLNNVGDLEQA